MKLVLDYSCLVLYNKAFLILSCLVLIIFAALKLVEMLYAETKEKAECVFYSFACRLPRFMGFMMSVCASEFLTPYILCLVQFNS